MLHYQINSSKNNIFKISGPTWNKNFELLDGSCSLSDIEDYFEYIIKKHKIFTGNPQIRICTYEKEKRITVKINKMYYLYLLTPETMKLLDDTKSKINKDRTMKMYII